MAWTGHILVPLDPVDDVARLLSEPDWRRYFDAVEVDTDLWDRLENAGFWSAVSARCGSIVDRYEEAWVDPDCVPFVQAEAEARLDQSEGLDQTSTDFLRAIARLASAANTRRAPIVFAF